MCLVRVKETEEHVVPYRVVDRHNSRRRTSHQSQRRYSRTEIVHQESPRPSASYVAVPAPKPLPIPAPQPVPVFVQPPPAPIPAPAPPPPPSSHHGAAHYVEVSPRSSISSRSSSPPRSEYVYREREIRRERETGPQYDHYRYVEPQRSESEVGYARSRSRQRSMSRGGYEDPRGSFREERTRIVIEDERGGGGRRRDYR
ncbi:hypothetical protein HBI25_026180 [Parastagonospora nodorum]|uniref:Uncharacterized protein n=1 Tax=Phaeosphaeria nodorum (strain SN15 / ATCC MYA-4574 / FGSC 10173) TaxID=321614 RepID=Q0UX47_PHANO|nr:hypothetical protein SNOG_03667 [Parastagonospora nodorum SN15]KAH3986542.1 hypothetical protein HBH52_045090 [Parastagonospora nodorum]EAT88872.1 hypothetical protein SNOG_03667 [Parastagonospora nodorum SN15]KAH4004627.1 hypothetical protein HBI10_042470 [Parastagonospora nodorum]KAH4040392.1 hypothetical protein HBI09_027440 [Parastagonospora nodorum]KAH4165629.1 hypothetical protein HBH44_067840 [Parastagonospora nodorum]